MPSTRLGAAALALLSSLPLLAGAAPAPVSAAEGSEPSDARVQVVKDPRGDVRRKPRDVRSAFRADLTSVRYRTPSRIGGELRITARWAMLWDGRRARNPDQLLWTEFVDTPGIGSWTVYVENDGDVYLEDYTGDEEVTDIEPERAEVDYDFGLNGRMDLRMSTEWMRDADPSRIAFTSWGNGRYGAQDPVAESRPLLVGEPR